MLSYRHAFHAGNHGDVLKHSVVTLIVQYLKNKEKPFVYIDTHAGAGRYDLHTEWAQKNREYETGILPLWQREDLPSELRPYIEVVRTMNPNDRLQCYPGSPWLVRQLMRKQDKARLFELHNNEVRILQTLFVHERHVKVEHADGLQALKAILPPLERRAFTLVDPSYEIKDEYVHVVNALTDAYRRFTMGVYLLWYPVIKRAYVARLENALRAGGIANILQAELTIAPESSHGMTGSGVIIINPPWTIAENLHVILPYLAAVLGRQNQGTYRIDMLAPE